MKKLLMVIITLCILIILSLAYLKEIRERRKAYPFDADEKTLILQKKDIVLEKETDFVFGECFFLIGSDDASLKYSFEENEIVIILNGREFRYPFRKKEPETIVIEKIVYQTIGSSDTKDRDDVREEEHADIVEDDRFRLKKKEAEFGKGTDISVIMNVISDCVDTNLRTSLDYSLLNPNETGTYSVFISSSKGTLEFLVKII